MATQAFSTPIPQASAAPLAEGDAGTIQTVQQMCRLVFEGAKDPKINRAAVAIVRAAGVREFDFEGERRALFAWMRRNVRFVRDADGVELLRAPQETLTVAMGDCDDQTMLLCALLKTIGQRVRIVTVATQHQAPDQFSHVFAEVRDERGRWITIDTARKSPRYGLGPNHWYRRWIWDPDTCEHCDASRGDCDPGVGGLGYYVANSFPLPTTGQGPFLSQPGMFGSPSQAGGLGALGVGSRTTRRRARRRLAMGDFEDVMSALAPSIPSITTGTANIITATRANPLNLVPNTGAPATGALTPAAAVAMQEAQLAAGGISTSSLLLFGGLALGLIFLIKGRGQQ